MAQKKVGTFPLEQRRPWIESNHEELSIVEQCRLSGVSRSGTLLQTSGRERREHRVDASVGRAVYANPVLRDSAYDLVVGDARSAGQCEAGSATAAAHGTRSDLTPNRGCRCRPRDTGFTHTSCAIWRLCVPIRFGPRISRISDCGRDSSIWWRSWTGSAGTVLAWEVSTSMDSGFCVSALDWALRKAQPEIFNTDQGAQFTSDVFTSRLKDQGITISMDGRGRFLDNIFVERLWRTVKYEEVYLKDYLSVPEAISNLSLYFRFYNQERGHQVFDYQTARGRVLSARARRLWELTQLWTSAHDADSHSCLKTSSKTRLFHSSHRLDDGLNINPFQRQQSTLRPGIFCPKNGDPLSTH